MIAIVGSKGGCEKTTTALGLAYALGRSGKPTVAVDTDRHLPTLHVTAAVDREPTLATLAENDLSDIVQRVPHHPDVGVIPAPTESESVAVDEQLRSLQSARPTVVLNCPSGSRADLREPLTAAGAAVVVTTDRTESLIAAAKTVGIANQFEVPVVGTVLTKTASVPAHYEDVLEVPVLATIPEVEDPLGTRSAREAFDSLAAAISTPDRAKSAPDQSKRRIETGIEGLDRALGGGFSSGSIVACVAPATSQSERLVYELATARETLYLTTDRTGDGVTNALESVRVSRENVSVRSIEGHGEDALEEANQCLSELSNESALVIDTMDALERADYAAYVEFLAELESRIRGIGGIAYLHCLRGRATPANRTRTEHIADAVFELETTRTGTDLETHLSVPKLRDDELSTTAIKLSLAQGAEIDTSRDIV